MKKIFMLFLLISQINFASESLPRYKELSSQSKKKVNSLMIVGGMTSFFTSMLITSAMAYKKVQERLEYQRRYAYPFTSPYKLVKWPRFIFANILMTFMGTYASKYGALYMSSEGRLVRTKKSLANLEKDTLFNIAKTNVAKGTIVQSLNNYFIKEKCPLAVAFDTFNTLHSQVIKAHTLLNKACPDLKKENMCEQYWSINWHIENDETILIKAMAEIKKQSEFLPQVNSVTFKETQQAAQNNARANQLNAQANVFHAVNQAMKK